MIRRKFLGILALPLFPAITNISDQFHLNVESIPLEIELIKNEFEITKLKISKGPYTVISHTANDCVDCCGVCATAELALLIKNELELGEENQRLMLERYWDFEDKERREWIESLKRFNLPLKDFQSIYSVLKKLRGSHNCVYK